MEKAVDLPGILRVVKPEPLKGKDFDNFFVETDKARGDKAAKYLENYFKANRDEDPQKVLFMGHRGSGKSTELYRLSTYLGDAFRVINFSIRDEIDITDMQYLDLIFVILNRLYEEVRDEVDIHESVLKNLSSYWHDEKFMETIAVQKAEVQTSVEASVGFLNAIRARVKGILSTGRESKEVVRKFIEPRLSQLITGINDFLDDISLKYKAKGKVLLLIVEDLDKLDISVAEELFLKHKNILTMFHLHIIYTFPIFLHYSTHFSEISSGFHDYRMLSMVKVNNKDGTRHDDGRAIFRGIAEKRVAPGLIEPAALEFLIEKSGGALRHLFDMMKNATLDVLSEDGPAVNLSAAEHAYLRFRSSFERTVGKKHLDTLKDVYESRDRKPSADENLQEMLNAMAVIEYNGDRWCGLHPAVEDILKERNLIGECR